MATTVAQHPVTAFTSPTNGTSPIDADEVVANDSAIRAAYNAHDADTGIHVQSSVFGSRPAAGTSGRKYITVDQLSAPTQIRSWYDDGTNWYEHNYFGAATTFAAAVTVSSGGITVTGNSTITGTLGGITTLTATTVAGTLSTAAQPNVTSVGTLTALTVSGDVTVDTSTLKVDSSNNRVGIGTASPAYLLDVQRASYGVSGYFATLDGTNNPRMVIYGSSSGTTIQHTYSTGSDALIFAVGGAIGSGNEAMRLTADLRLGIGTASPSTPLHVVGASTLAGAVTVSSGGIAVTGASTVSAGSTTNALIVTTTGAIQQSLRYDSSNRLDISVSSAGAVTFDAVGSGATFVFSDSVTFNGTLITVTNGLTVTGSLLANGSLSLGSDSSDTIQVLGVFTNNLVPFVSSGYSLGTSGNTWSAAYADRVFTAASATGGAGLRLPHGAAPSSPVDGDMWTTSSGLFVRINGVTKTVTLT